MKNLLGMSVSVFIAFYPTLSSAERLEIPEATSQRILTLGNVLASWPVESIGAVNFSRLFYVSSDGLIYLCRVEERGRDIITNCFARSTPEPE